MAFNDQDKLDIKKLFDLVHKDEFKERQFKEEENRDCYQRDYARILYSASFRRLQGKMQILGIDNTAFFRNRLTHSLEVSQIATGILVSIYQQLGEKDIPMKDYFVIEAAALAHDIGHPAFGHSGERILNELGKDFDIRFEGNAHNFRVLRTLEKKLPNEKGLNLTYRTLLAINKYIVPEDEKDKDGELVEKFIFKDDYKFLDEFRKKLGIRDQRTVDVQIIELADDIAYAAHDLEDGLSTRSFTIEELIYKLDLKKVKHLDDFKKIVNDAKEKANQSSSYKTNQEYSQVFRQSLTSALINLLLSDLSFETPSKDDIAKRGTSKKYKELTLGKYASLCKEISKEVFKCITREPHIAIYEARGKKLVTDLFKLYSDPYKNVKGYLFPPDYRYNLTQKDTDGKEQVNCKGYAQAAIDYIAGMMDDYAKIQYKQFFNKDFNEINFA